MNTFEIGKTYFTFGFLDKEFDKYEYPVISSWVYLGKNLLEMEIHDLWFFQDVESYLELGPYTAGDETTCSNAHKGSETITRQIMTFQEDALSELYTMESLMHEIARYVEEK